MLLRAFLSELKDVRPKAEEILSNLLYALAVIFIVMWLLGFALHFTLGGFIHLLLLLAIISVLVRLITGHRIA